MTRLLEQLLAPPNRVLALKCAAVAMLVLGSASIWTATVAEYVGYHLRVGSYRWLIIYTGVSVLCLLALAVAPFLRSTALRVAFVLIMMIGFVVERATYDVTLRSPDLSTIDLYWTNIAMIPDVAVGYRADILRALAFLVPLSAILMWRPGRWTLPSAAAAIPIAAFALVFAVTSYTKGSAGQFIAPISVASDFVVVTNNGQYRGKRDEVRSDAAPTPVAKKIVLIVDESVRGDHIGLTDPVKTTTPFMVANPGHFINFGNAVSATNCSAQSRLVLRTGLRRDQIPDRAQLSRKAPTIWQYAQMAGFRTVYVNGFARSGSLAQHIALSSHSHMTTQERKAIEEEIPVSHEPAYERDALIADKLRDLLSRDERLFILVEKYGAHIPYTAAFAPGYLGSERPPVDNDKQDPRFSSRTYRIAIRWSVDRFFERLLQGLDLGDTLILYTSDHGQSLPEEIERQTHCTVHGKIHPAEANVPFIALTGQEHIRPQLRDAARFNFDALTHFEMFPTLLWALGYDRSWIEPRYGATALAAHDGRARQFFSGSLFGDYSGWRWTPVDVQPTRRETDSGAARK